MAVIVGGRVIYNDGTLEPWLPLIAGAAAVALLGIFLVVLVGFVRPARKELAYGPVKVGAGDMLGGAITSLGEHPGAAAALVVLGALGSLAVDVITFASWTFSAPANLAWWVVSCLIVFHWHRSVLQEEGRALGFDIESASVASILGRSFLMGIILLASLLLAAIPMIAVGAAGVANPLALAAIGGVSSLIAITVLVWNSRFVIALPAAALRQPDRGILEMHGRAKGLGVPLTSALSVLTLAFIILAFLTGLLGDAAWSAVAPEEYAAPLNISVSEIMLRPTFRPWEFVLFNIPMGILVAFHTVLCVSVVSIAYRRWILPEYEEPSKLHGAR